MLHRIAWGTLVPWPGIKLVHPALDSPCTGAVESLPLDQGSLLELPSDELILCVCVCMCAHAHVPAHSVMFDSLQPHRLAHQAPLSMDFSRQEYWSGLPFPPPGHLPDPSIKPATLVSPAWQVDCLPLSLWGSLSSSWGWWQKERRRL